MEKTVGLQCPKCGCRYATPDGDCILCHLNRGRNVKMVSTNPQRKLDAAGRELTRMLRGEK